MAEIHSLLQRLVMQEAKDSQRLKEELRRAEAQDRDTYGSTWADYYAYQPHTQELLEYAREQASRQRPGFSFLFPFVFVFFATLLCQTVSSIYVCSWMYVMHVLAF